MAIDEHLLVRYIIQQWVTWLPVVVAGQGGIETRYLSAEWSLVHCTYLVVGDVAIDEHLLVRYIQQWVTWLPVVVAGQDAI